MKCWTRLVYACSRSSKARTSRFATRRSSASISSKRTRLTVLRDDVDERGLAGLHPFDASLDRRPDVLRLIDRAFAIPAEALRDRRKIRGRVVDLLAEVGHAHVPLADFGHANLVLPVVVVGAIVEHDQQNRDLVMRRDPQRS